MGKRESAPQVNAGSMADIAFLLLIFFLVTTVIETDTGLHRMLPRESEVIIDHHKRNILPVLIDDQEQLLVADKVTEIENLKELATNFIDNGGSYDNELFCDYCGGNRNPSSSENPQKAIIVISHARETSYGTYITVQNELVAAYNALRNREAKRRYGKDFSLMEVEYQNPTTTKHEKVLLAKRIKHLQSLYPLNISEAELKNQ